MGKFGIGARVRDDGGDEGVIVEKAKGQRLVKYDYEGYGKLWQAKGYLTALPASDNARAETSENAYSVSGGEAVSAWEPKVGDRVRVVKHCNWRGEPLRLFAPIGSEHEVTEMRHYFDNDGVATFVLSGGGGNFYTALNVEPVVAPATTWTPVVGERVKPKPEHDTWVRGHWADSWAAKEGPLDEMFVAGVGYSPESFLLSNRIGGNGPYWTTEQMEPAPLTIEAGKSYRTRDGRKVGPMRRGSSFSEGFYWVAPTVAGTSFGSAWHQDGIFHPKSSPYWTEKTYAFDLVAEWVEPVDLKAEVEAGRMSVNQAREHIGLDPLPPVAVAEATATAWHGGKATAGTVVRCDRWDGALFTPGRTYTFDARGEVTADDGSKWDGIYAGSWSLVELVAPPAKFKVGDRVRHIELLYEGEVVGMVDDRHVKTNWPSKGWGATDPIVDLELISPSNRIPVGSTVTFTATGRLSAYTTDGHAQIVFPGLTPGQNSFALPAKFVTLAN